MKSLKEIAISTLYWIISLIVSITIDSVVIFIGLLGFMGFAFPELLKEIGLARLFLYSLWAKTWIILIVYQVKSEWKQIG